MSITQNSTANRTIFVAAMLGLLAAGWYMSGVLADVSNFNDWDKSKEYSSIVKAVCLFIAAFLLGIGVDFRSMLGPLAAFIPGLGGGQLPPAQTPTAPPTPTERQP